MMTPVLSGSENTMGVSLASSSGGATHVEIRVRDSVRGVWVYLSGVVPLVAGRSVVNFTADADIPSGSMRAFVIFWASADKAPLPSGRNAYMGAVTFEEGVTSGSYFDGSTDPDGDRSYAWTGLENQSTSVEMLPDGGWLEVPSLRTIALTDDGDDKDPAGVQSLAAVWIFQFFLTKLQVFDPPDLDSLVDGKRMFNSSTPGAILQTLFDEGLLAGWGNDPAWTSPLDYDFTSTHDSAGVPWPQQLSIGYEPGLDLWTLISNLADQDLLSMGSTGRTLHLWAADRGTDRSVGNTPVQLGTQAASLPIKRDASKLTTTARVRGEGGFRLEVDADTPIVGLGKLFTTISQGGVSDPGTAALLAQAELNMGSQVREQISVTMAAAATRWLPWIHFELGDWVMARVRDSWRSVRVVEFVVSKDNAGAVTVSPVLNDRFTELTARLAKRTTGIAGGASAGGSGGTPTTEDRRPPKAPTTLVLDSAGYWSNAGDSLSQLSATWTAVTQGTNDVAIEVAVYELWGRIDDGAAESNALTLTDTNALTSSPYTPGVSWLMKVRARSKDGVWGAFSAEAPVTMAQPTFTLPAPSAPSLTSDNGIVEVSWPGTFATDPITGPPPHFRQINVYMSASEVGEYALVGTLFAGAERMSLIGLGVGSGWWFQLSATDRLGRESPLSTPEFIEVLGIDGADIIADSVTANSIVAGSIETRHLASGFGGALDISANESVSIVVGQISTVSDNLGDTTEALADLRQRYDYTADELRISKPGSGLAFALNNERIEARDGTAVLAYWEGGVMHADQFVGEQVELGEHRFEAAPEGVKGTVMRTLN